MLRFAVTVPKHSLGVLLTVFSDDQKVATVDVNYDTTLASGPKISDIRLRADWCTKRDIYRHECKFKTLRDVAEYVITDWYNYLGKCGLKENKKTDREAIMAELDKIKVVKR